VEGLLHTGCRVQKRNVDYEKIKKPASTAEAGLRQKKGFAQGQMIRKPAYEKTTKKNLNT